MNTFRAWNLETRSLDELIPHSSNPRVLSKNDADQLKKSIRKFGLVDKPVITASGKIIGGHQRIRILQELGFTDVECWVIDDEELTEREVDELNIRLNRNVGDWDWDKLANTWDVNDLLDWGFEDKEFEETMPMPKASKVTFEFSEKEELHEFLDKMQRFPEKEIGSWTFKMKVKCDKEKK